MTDDEAAFLRAICDQPEDDAPRLVYADWLDERGDKASLNRATFIRAQIAYAKLPARCDKTTDPLEPALTSRKFYRHHCRCRVCKLRRAAYYAGRSYIEWRWPPICLPHYVAPNRWQRGFIEGLRTTINLWVQHGARIVQATPLRYVQISDRKPYSVQIQRGDRFLERFQWYNYHSHLGDLGDCYLPPALFARLQGGKRLGRDYWLRQYKTAQLAQADLSRACLLFARQPHEAPA